MKSLRTLFIQTACGLFGVSVEIITIAGMDGTIDTIISPIAGFVLFVIFIFIFAVLAIWNQ